MGTERRQRIRGQASWCTGCCSFSGNCLICCWIGCSAEEKSSREPGMMLTSFISARPRLRTSVAPCIARWVTGGRAARTGMSLLQPFCTPPQNSLYTFRRHPKTPLQRPNGVFRVTRSSCGGRGNLPDSVLSDGPLGRLYRRPASATAAPRSPDLRYR